MKQIVAFLTFFFFSLSNSAQIGLPIQQSVLPKNSLVVNYDFSNTSSYIRGSTTVSNISGTGNGSVVSAPIFMNSLGFISFNSFNGTDQYLISPNVRTYFKSLNSSVQRSFSMSLWAYPTSLNGVIVSEHESQTLNSGFFTSNIELVNGVVRFKVWNGTVLESTPILSNQWHHIAMVYNGTSLKGFVNGILQGIQSYDRTIPPGGQFYGIGSQSNTNMGSGAFGKFHLAQFKLHNLPLSDNEVKQEYDLRKSEFDYTIHSPSTNSSPTYWGVSNAWNSSSGSVGSPDPFGFNHFTPWLNSGLGWAAQTLDANQWITLNYDEPAFLKGVVIQGRLGGWQLVTKAHVETSLTGSAPWTRILSNINVNNTTNPLDDVRLDFPNNTFAKTIRLLPTEYSNHITLRMGLLVKPNEYITDGLVLNLDPANIKSYQGTGSTLSDLSISRNHATLTGSPTYNASNGFTYNGSTQYGRIPSVNGVSNFTNAQQYSIEIWFNPSNGQPNAGEAELLEKWNLNNESRYPYTIRFNENGSSMMVAAFDGSRFPNVSVTGFPVNTWKQLVAVFDFVSKSLLVYRDGVLAGSTSLNLVGQVSNTSPVGIAGRVAVSTGALQVPFKGAIGIIRMYNKVLSPNEVLQNFNANKSRYGL